MATDLRILARSEVGRDRWDGFVEASDDCWLWHRWDLIEALSLWPGQADASFAVVDGRGALQAIMPLHRKKVRVGAIVPCVRFNSLGGPARAASNGGAKALARIQEHLRDLVSSNHALAAEVQVSPLTPALTGPSAPKVNPLLAAGLRNTQGETWIVDLERPDEDIRRSYSESTRRRLRKAWTSEFRLRDAAGPNDLETYYRLHLETYARTSARSHPIEYFQAIFEKFQPRGLARIMFFERQGRVIAAQNTALYKGGAFYWTGASLSEKEGDENHVLFDAQIIAARGDGCARYETGQAFVRARTPKERGLSRFKGSFGAELHPFYRGVLDSPRRSLRIVWALRDLAGTVRSARP